MASGLLATGWKTARSNWGTEAIGFAGNPKEWAGGGMLMGTCISATGGGGNATGSGRCGTPTERSTLVIGRAARKKGWACLSRVSEIIIMALH